MGGSAEVYLARPKLGERPAPQLVVKRLLPSAREGSDFEILEREATLHQAVRHPNVVKVFGAGMVNGEPFIAMEYVEGVDLFRLLRRAEAEHRRMPSGLAVYVARQVATALESVHSATDATGTALNIVHRDISPSNVYLSVDGDVKVGDFGIARASAPRRAPTQAPGGLKGKFGYLAPEQVAGEPFDNRADLFALTVLLGEMLIGERVFPGSGQLAVLLAIRDGNIERLRTLGRDLPAGLLATCERGLARRPEDRYSTATDLGIALAPFELPDPQSLKQMLSDWVKWARDSGQFAHQLEGRIRDSVHRMRAVRLASSVPPSLASVVPFLAMGESVAPADTTARVRRVENGQEEQVSFPKLLEMIATGDLGRNDQVALMGAGFVAIGDIDELARHLLPSTTSTTVKLHGPGVPDYQALLGESTMSSVLAHMRHNTETGALFVSRRDGPEQRRKEIYLKDGRLHHVASSERDELLGEYLVKRGALERPALDVALELIGKRGGRLGDTLINLGLVEAMDVFRAIRDQGRDRVAALCGWEQGTVAFYRDTAPGRVEFPLDLDLSSPMMAGALVASHGNPRMLLPPGGFRVQVGPRGARALTEGERGTAPLSLQLIPRWVREGLMVETLVQRLAEARVGREARQVGEKEASAALVTASELGWIVFSP